MDRTAGPLPRAEPVAALRRMIADEEEAELGGTGYPQGDSPCRHDGSGSQAGVEQRGIGMEGTLVTQRVPRLAGGAIRGTHGDRLAGGAGTSWDEQVPPCGAGDTGGSSGVLLVGEDTRRCGTGDPGPPEGDPPVRDESAVAGPLGTLGVAASLHLPDEKAGSGRAEPLDTAQPSCETTRGTTGTAQETEGTAREEGGCAAPEQPAAGERPLGTGGETAEGAGTRGDPAGGAGRPEGTEADPVGGEGGRGPAGTGPEGEDMGEGGGRGDAASEDNSWHPETESEDDDEDDDDDVRVCDPPPSFVCNRM